MAVDAEEPGPGTSASNREQTDFQEISLSHNGEPAISESTEEDLGKPTRWSMGILNDPDTHEVPG